MLHDLAECSIARGFDDGDGRIRLIIRYSLDRTDISDGQYRSVMTSFAKRLTRPQERIHLEAQILEFVTFVAGEVVGGGVHNQSSGYRDSESCSAKSVRSEEHCSKGFPPLLHPRPTNSPFPIRLSKSYRNPFRSLTLSIPVQPQRTLRHL
jgi:hypothetical protein